MPTISLIIPTYNVQKYIDVCLSSLREQTLSRIEIIVVNDGSTDGSEVIAKAHASEDKRIVLINQDNQGLSAARNKGLTAATGEFVGFIDSDDWVSPDYCQKLYCMALQSNADIVRSGIIEVDSNGGSVKWPSVHFKIPEYYRTGFSLAGIGEAALKLPVMAWSGLLRLDFLKRYRLSFPIGLVHEDEYFTTLAMALAGRIAVASDAVYYYRRHPGSITGLDHQSLSRLDIFPIFCRLHDDLVNQNVPNTIIDMIINRKCIPQAIFNYQWCIPKGRRFSAWLRLRKMKRCFGPLHRNDANWARINHYSSLLGLFTQNDRYFRIVDQWMGQRRAVSK